tara:strand:+ start:459 stop:1469 length:1011 start_codon:yes stop_codon:yes gene_type:complete
MQQTLNQILQNLTYFADAHTQVFSSGFGFKSDINSFVNNNPNLSCLFFEITGNTFNTNTQDYNFRIYCLDAKQKDNNNLQDVLSDTSQILVDLRKYLINVFETNGAFWSDNINSNSSVPYTNYTDDLLIGWSLDIQISSGLLISDCDIPLGPVTGGGGGLPSFNCDLIVDCSVITNIESNITSIESNITSIENNITLIENDLLTIDATIDIIQDAVTDNQTDITAIETTLLNNQTAFEAIKDLGDVSGTVDIDWSLAVKYKMNLTNNITLTFSNYSNYEETKVQGLEITSNGAYVVTFPVGVDPIEIDPILDMTKTNYPSFRYLGNTLFQSQNYIR